LVRLGLVLVIDRCKGDASSSKMARVCMLFTVRNVQADPV
jgi:hypothetical protein